MLESLAREDRLQLMKFVCSFAWADLEVQSAEKDFVKRLVDKLKLGEDEREQVRQWLEVPPPAEELDPADIPRAHRKIFYDAIRALVLSDGKVNKTEVENLALFEMLLKGD